MSSLDPIGTSKNTYPLGLQVNVSSRNSVQFCQQTVCQSWWRLGSALPTPYRLVQTGNLGSFIAVQWARLAKGASFSQRLALCEGSEVNRAMLILESDCTFVFVVLLWLTEGFGVFEALSFDSRRPHRCRVARRATGGTILWLMVVRSNHSSVSTFVTCRHTTM